MYTKNEVLLTPPSPAEPFEVDEVLPKLSTTEKIQLLSGTTYQLKVSGHS